MECVDEPGIDDRPAFFYLFGQQFVNVRSPPLSVLKVMDRRCFRAKAFAIVAAILFVDCCFVFASDSSQESLSRAWLVKLEAARGVMLTGDSYASESAWADVRLTRFQTARQRWNPNPKDVRAWLQMQKAIVESTKADPLKESLRITAVQEFMFFPKEGLEYMDWLEGLKNNVKLGSAMEEKVLQVLRSLRKWEIRFQQQ